MQGGTLYDLLIGTAPALYTDVQAVRWVLQLAKALKSLHEGNPQIVSGFSGWDTCMP